MKINKFYYILILTISFFIISNISSLAAEDTLVSTGFKMKEEANDPGRDFFGEIIDAVNRKIINPVKNKITSIGNKGIDKTSNEIINNVQNQVKEKQDELMDKAGEKAKQTIKEKSKNFMRNRIEWIKGSLSPLKLKIQQGSDIIKKEVNRAMDYLKDLF